MRTMPRKTKAQPKRAAKKRAVKPAVKAFPKTATVLVMQNDRGEFIVDPPVASVRRGGIVTFRSKVGRLTVFVPTPNRAADLFPRARGPVFGVPAKGKKLIVSVAKAKEPTAYIYSVYCHKAKTFAKASFPRIIVGP